MPRSGPTRMARIESPELEPDSSEQGPDAVVAADAEPPEASGALSDFSRMERVVMHATTALPVPLLLYLGFNGGGFARGITGVAATLLAILLALRAAVAPRTVCRPGPLGTLATGALLAMAAWSFLSGTWSQSAWRAIAEFDRTALYLLAVLTFVTLPRVGLRPVLRSVTAAMVVLVLVGLATRLRPDLFAVAPTVSPQRLSYPLGYWNALGVMAAMALVLCLHAAADVSGHLAVRVLGAALWPPLAVALYLTLSRGGIGAAVAGVALYLVLAPPRGLLVAIPAIAPVTYFAVSHAYDATALISQTPTSAAAVAQGRTLLGTVVVCAVAAGALRIVLASLDVRIARVRVPSPTGWRRGLAWGGAAALLVVAAIAAGAPAALQQQYDRFVSNAPTNPIVDPRARLGEVYNSGRVSHWKVALTASRDDRLRGVGAGTYDLQWNRLRSYPTSVTQAHSLYVETLSELGIVGLAALVSAIVALLAGTFAYRRSRPQRAAAAAVMLVWALHAALDWDWEMPAVTLGPFILCATAAAAAWRPGPGARRTAGVVAAAALVLAVLPALQALGETRLGQALRAYDRAGCAAATADAERAHTLLPMRPEPSAILALCAARAGDARTATRLAHDAVESDPLDWEWRYLDALVIGATGGDPLPELRAARERNPLGVPPEALQAVLGEAGRQAWEQRTREAYVWFHGRAHAAIGF
jgi:hypothetical protein